MSDIIKLLPDSVANQIAAGEVIQRPASVVKELVENAVDAGAHSISIIIKDAGRTLIQVIDDGIGMSETDARMAFERHATSKITKADDLYTLHTMGFRGEALPSIAAVAQIELRSRRHDAELGTKLIINGSRVDSQEPTTASAGTNIMVKNLFFNIPVRRKFLKKDAVELSNILKEFERLALVNIDIELSISHNDTLIHHLRPATFKQRIIDLFGKSLERQLIPISTETSLVKLDGYVGLPECARRRGALQYLTVNGRNMRHPYFHKAILQCYSELIASDMQPLWFVNFTVDPSTVDVNIHPTKNEIKFENEQPIWQILTAAVRESLARYNAMPAIEFDNTDAPEIPAYNPDSHALHGDTYDASYNPFEIKSPASGRQSAHSAFSSRNGSHHNAVPADWEKLYADFNNADKIITPDNTVNQIDHAADTSWGAPQVSTLQIKNRYIISPSKAGMLIIDQHRAHIAVLFDSYMDRIRNGQLHSQQILFPESISLSASQSVVLMHIMEEINRLGFKLEKGEADSQWIINAVPDGLINVSISETLLRMIDTATESGEMVTEDIYTRLALAMARSAAIGSDAKLSVAEQEQLVASLLSLPAPGYTPDGLKVMVTITSEEIKEMLS